MGFYDRMQQRLSGGNSFADRMAQRLQTAEADPYAPESGGFVNRPGGPTLEEIDAERAAADLRAPVPAPDPGFARFKPWSGPAQVPLQQQSEAGKPVWSAHSTASDAVAAAAGGVLSGIGVNPREALGDQAGGRVRMAHESSPWVAGGAQLLGEGAIQAAAAPARLARAPAAMGALSGLLSGVGNTEGAAADKAKAGVGGAATGAWAGHIVGGGTGSLASLLERKAPQFAENQVTHGLMGAGATPDDLARMDQLPGGRQRFYDDKQRLGISGGPQQAAWRAREAVEQAAQERAAIEARNAGVQVDPNAVEAAVRSANPYPGVGRYDRAIDRAAEQVRNAAPDPAALDVQRGYYGDATNFASGSPNAKLGKGVHGAINDEIEDAYNLANPGSGTQHRQLGRDMNAAMELGPIAQGAHDRRLASDIRFGDVASLGSLRVLNNNRHGIAEAAYGAAAPTAEFGAGALNALLPGVNAMSGAAGGQFSANQFAERRDNEARNLDQSALDMLYAGGAELGAYKSQFAQAAGSPDPGAVSALITRLVHTDPQFRSQLLPLLRGAR